MHRKSSYIFAIFLGLSISTSALSDAVADYYSVLKHIPAKYSVDGTVCEKIAVLDLEEIWQDEEYTVLNGLVYTVGNRTVGELDIVIFKDNNAVLVGEVKCQNGLLRAIKSAREQLRRFDDFISSETPNYKIFLADNPEITFTKMQFADYPDYSAISYIDSGEYGFDLEIGVTLHQARTLRHQLVRCQMQGECPQAN